MLISIVWLESYKHRKEKQSVRSGLLKYHDGKLVVLWYVLPKYHFSCFSYVKICDFGGILYMCVCTYMDVHSYIISYIICTFKCI